MRNIRLVIEYEGTHYAGWQVQHNLPSIQGTIQEKLKILTGEDITLTSASRTDAGVHALGQVANFRTASHIPLHSFQTGLNALLPDDIVVKNAEGMPHDFDARRHAKAKTYRYLILNRPYPSAMYRNFSWHVFQGLNIDAMRKAAGLLVGRKDFTSFRAVECDAPHSIREVLFFSVGLSASHPSPLPSRAGEEGLMSGVFLGKYEEEGLLVAEVKGTAFLRHMVRIMVGTLVAIGKGKIEADDFQAIIDARDRRLAGMTAPPHGLFLKEVEY